MARLWATLLFWACFLLPQALAQQSTLCSAAQPCVSGCCSKYGQCGFGPDYCGDGCQANCNAKAECGQYGNTTLCPLNVCCSKFGFCGTTADFCGDGCQNGCAPVNRPSCAEDDTTETWERKIAYYELFGSQRPCDTMVPENIPAGLFTHINLAFAEIGSDFQITDTDGALVAKVSRLKSTYQGLRVNIAVGGWNFNDPPTQSIFTNMASTAANRQKFILSVVRFLLKYGLDGIDIDWEYPVATDRGGNPADYNNYPQLIKEMRTAFDYINPAWEITITIPSSYWYLRGFNLPELQKHVSWFNMMSYDLHGMWDQYNQFTGPYLLGHTNITEIDQGLDLLWRNRVDPKNVVMGMAFYGRSFTMADPNCYEPGCTFSAAGIPGDCSQTAGILIYAEIVGTNGTINSNTYYDPVSTVKYNVFDGTQWVSYDDAQSFEGKRKFLSSRCLSGAMVWAIDQDDSMLDATSGLFGSDAGLALLQHSGNLTDPEKNILSFEFGAYNGMFCYTTQLCTDGSAAQSAQNQVCAFGYTSVATGHNLYQSSSIAGSSQPLNGTCSKGWYRQVCCPESYTPQNCQWNNNPSANSQCGGECSSTQFQLNADTFADAAGNKVCTSGERKLCCDSTEILEECTWTGCQGPIDWKSGKTPTCPSGQTYMTLRYDTDAGESCSTGHSGADYQSYARAYCCPSNDVPQKCHWSNDLTVYDPYADCNPEGCSVYEVKYTQALDPPSSSGIYSTTTNGNIVNCAAYPPTPGSNPFYSYCCDPPNEYNDKWPVDPSYLWQNYYSDAGAAVSWAYADNFANNNQDKSQSGTYGDDAYGFVMLDGPAGSMDTSFSTNFVVARQVEDENMQVKKRSILTNDPKVLDSVFDHAEETVYVFCKHPVDDPRCYAVFQNGATDTIITLPDHIGDGPFGRVVSMTLDDETKLPPHHLRARSAEKNKNPVYKLKFDYNFHEIVARDDSTINMRVDFTNLESYWNTVTDTPASKKRSVQDDHMTNEEFRSHVRRARQDREKLRKRSETPKEEPESSVFDPAINALRNANPYVPTRIGKRWFGSFVNWLSRLNNIESKNVGYLSMVWNKSILLYHAVAGCATSTAYAELSINLDANVDMEATYAYYFSGTLVPPAITGTYAYFGLEPSAYLGLRVDGFASMQYTSPRVKLVDTLAYPGLAIKGIAAVGPTLDVWGQIQGKVVISGQMTAGVRFNFEKQEWYWPEDSDSTKYQELLGLTSDPAPIAQSALTPEFSANVQATADLDILVTPEANMGIQIGGGAKNGPNLILNSVLVDAKVVGYVNTTLRFHAEATAGVSSGGGAGYSYSYGIYLLYNIGYGAVAKIPLFPWYATFRDLYTPPKVVTLYMPPTVSSSSKRDLPDLSSIKLPRRSIFEHYASEHADDSDLTYGYIRSNNSAVDGASGLPLERRQSGSTPGVGGSNDQSTADFNNLWQLFQCPEGSGCNCNCASGLGTPNGKRDVIPEFLPNATLREDWSPAVKRAAAATTTGTTTTPGRNCPSTLPDLKVNCNIFLDAQASGPGGTVSTVGICNNERQFFTRSGFAETGFVLTYDPDSSRVDARRTYACPSQTNAGVTAGFCLVNNINLYSDLGLSTTLARTAPALSCDEFPFASTEEGGIYYGTFPGVNAAIQARCTPVYQQDLQKLCNAIPRTLSTNVAYADDNAAPADWRSWASTDWTPTQPGGPTAGFGRTALYPGYVFNPSIAGRLGDGGITGAAWRAANQRLSYYQRRNFTYGLAFPSSATDSGAWANPNTNAAVTTWKWNDGTPGTFTTANQIVCAMNIFGQSNIYQYGNYNGYCVVPSTSQDSGVFGYTVKVKSCKVSFQGSAGPTKRSVGSFGDWEVESVEIDENSPVVAEIPIEMAEQMGYYVPANTSNEDGKEENGSPEMKMAAAGVNPDFASS